MIISFPTIEPDPADVARWRQRLAGSAQPGAYAAGYLANYIEHMAGSGTVDAVRLRQALAVAVAWDAVSRERKEAVHRFLASTCAICGGPVSHDECPGPRVITMPSSADLGLIEPRADAALADVTEGPEIVAADGSVA